MGARQNKIKYRNALHNKKVPILTLDARWHELFPDRLKSYKIRSLESKVNNELKKHGKLRSELLEYSELKKKLLDGIVENMNGTLDSAESKDQNKLEQGKKIIEELNDKLEKTQEQLLNIPKELDKVNKDLLVEGLEYCYDKMTKNSVQISDLDKFILETRDLLKQKIILKQEMEEENERIYTYLHNVVGYDVLGLMDIKREELRGNQENDKK